MTITSSACWAAAAAVRMTSTEPGGTRQNFHLEHLDRQAYKRSVETIADRKSQRFADQSMQWWDRHFSWKAHGCVVLADDESNHLSYIFYKIDRYYEYMTVHNILTPLEHRDNGYAKELLGRTFDTANDQHVSRFRLSSVPQSLGFYMPLGFVYWGINSVRDYYCDLPMPKAGLDDLDGMVRRCDIRELVGSRLDAICTKVEGNECNLNLEQQTLYDNDVATMGRHYQMDALRAYQKRNQASE